MWHCANDLGVGAGMNDMLTTFLNSSIVDANMNSLAANLAGVSHSLLSTPFLGEAIDTLQLGLLSWLEGRLHTNCLVLKTLQDPASQF